MPYTPQEVLEEIKKLKKMSELEPEKFGEEGGYADSLVSDEKFRKELKPTQLRKIFNELKSIYRRVKKEEPTKSFDRKGVPKLLTMLAYTYGRGLIPKVFYEIMKEALKKDKIKTNEDFLRFHDFFEAILAFHKYRTRPQEGGEK
jgi:CRISPR type III-A-associated protein Csm2